jgi:hypothetical protein
MKNDLILNKYLKRHTHIVKATIATRKPCRFPKPLLHLLQEKGVLTPNTVASELLCNPHLTKVAQSWINAAFSQGLISRDDNGEMLITEEGKKYLENGKAFVPEEGEWMITFCDADCRIENRILDIRKFNSTKMKIDQRKELDNCIQRSSRSLYFKKIYDTDISSMLESENIVKTLNGKEYRIIDINTEESPWISSEEDFCIQWNVSKKSVSYNYENHEYPIEALPSWAKETKEEIISQAVTNKLSLLNLDVSFNKNGKLEIPFLDSLSDETKRNLAIKCPISKTSVGNWDETTIPIEVMPMTEFDANEWFRWLFIDGLDNYLTNKHYNVLTESIAQKLDWQQDEMGKEEFLKDILENCEVVKEKKMLIQATLDWSL